MEEARLVKMAQQGDAAAFGELVRRVQHALLACARQMTRSADDADDLAQEALVEAFRCLPALHDPARFRGWLFAILRHRCRTYLQKQRPSVPLDAVAEVAAPSTAEHDDLLALLDRLSLEDRELLAARYLQDLEFHEIAKLYGTNAVAIRMRVSRARARLRKLAEGDEKEMRELFAGLLLAFPQTDLSHRVITEVSTMTQINSTTAAGTVLVTTAKHAFLTGAAGKATLALAAVLALGGGYYAAGTKGMVPLPPQLASAAATADTGTTETNASESTITSVENNADDAMGRPATAAEAAQVPDACKEKMQRALDKTMAWIKDHDGQLPTGEDWAMQVGLRDEELTCPEGKGKYFIITAQGPADPAEPITLEQLASMETGFGRKGYPLLWEINGSLKDTGGNLDLFTVHGDNIALYGWTTGEVSAYVFPPDAKEKAMTTQCIANMRQLAMVAIMLARDNGNRFPTVEAWDKQCADLIKQSNGKVLECPHLGTRDSYAYNSAAAGQQLDKIAHPESLVTLYEVRDGKPDFRHDGTMLCAFADGHVEQMSREKFQSLNVK